jgi:hypothetical protein
MLPSVEMKGSCAFSTRGTIAKASPLALPPPTMMSTLSSFDQATRCGHRLAGLRFGIVEHPLDLAAVDAALGIDLIDGKLHPAFHVVAEERAGTCHREHRADLERRIGLRHRRGRGQRCEARDDRRDD